MPRKRTAPTLPLRVELVDWLLDGAVRNGDDNDPARAPGVYDAFLEFDTPGPDLPALWATHRAWLLEEWRRRGGVGQPWAARFDQKEQL